MKWSICWRPALSSSLLRRSRPRMCSRPGPACARWSRIAAKGASLRMMKREHALWVEPGCVTLAGGKLTTFRLLALEVLRACAPFVGRTVDDQGAATFAAVPSQTMPTLSPAQQKRLIGRYGRALPQLLALVDELGVEQVAGTDTLWAELAWAAEQELVLQLDDLLLRRTRLGLLLALGAAAELPRIRALCQARLGWSDARWQLEEADYLALWARCYSLPQH